MPLLSRSIFLLFLFCEAMAEPKVEEKLGVKIERNPSEARLSELGVRSWPT